MFWKFNFMRKIVGEGKKEDGNSGVFIVYGINLVLD